jgi:hypothetical protein
MCLSELVSGSSFSETLSVHTVAETTSTVQQYKLVYIELCYVKHDFSNLGEFVYDFKNSCKFAAAFYSEC